MDRLFSGLALLCEKASGFATTLIAIIGLLIAFLVVFAEYQMVASGHFAFAIAFPVAIIFLRRQSLSQPHPHEHGVRK